MAGLYEPIRAFDAPDILFTQLMQGELRGSTITDTLLRPNDLSIEERDSYADKLKESLGNHNISNALVDVAKNPFFWLMFFMSPIGGKVVGAGKKVIFEGPERLSAYVKENEGLFGYLKLLTANEYFSGTATPAAMGGISKALEKLHRARRRILQEPLDEWAKANGVNRGFDPKAYPDKPEIARKLERLNASLYGSMTMRNRDVYQPMASFQAEMQIYKQVGDQPVYAQIHPRVEPTDVIQLDTPANIAKADALEVQFKRELAEGRDPGFYYRRTDKHYEVSGVDDEISYRRGWGGDDPEQVIRELGAGRILAAYKELRKAHFVRGYLTPWRGRGHVDAAGKPYMVDDVMELDGVMYVVDDRKLLQVWRAHKEGLFRKGQISKDESVPARGLQMMREAMSQEGTAMLGGGATEMGWEDFLRLTRRMVRDTMNHNTYLPRNVVEILGKDMKTVAPDMVSTSNRGDALYASSRTIPRTATDVLWHPDDLEQYARVMNVPKDSRIWNLIRNNRRQIEHTVGRQGQAPVHRIDPMDAMERYMKDMDETTVMFNMRPSEEYLKHQQMYFKRSQSPFADKTHGPTKPVFDPVTGGMVQGAESAKVSRPFLEVEAEARAAAARGEVLDRVPLGGFNYADGVYAEHSLLNNSGARDKLTNILLPTVLGRLSSANKMNVISGGIFKQAAQWFVNSPFKKMFEEAGDWGKNFSARMQRASELDLKELWGSREMASYLYVSHLGVNMASVMLNLMQPLLLGVPWLGGRAVMYGYKEALKEMGTYFKARRGMPLRISDMDRDGLIRKSFKWGGRDGGDDLLDIHGTIFHTVDAVAEGKTSFRTPSWKQYLFQDAPMKMFEKAEWLNRLVMSHAAEYTVRAKGMTDPIHIARNVHDMIRQTQYGAHVMNTPLLMLPYRPAGGGGRAQNWLSDPTMRQFMMFPLRTLTGFMYAPQLIAGDFHHPAKAMLSTWVRALGTGAVAHSVLKNMVGADMSRGLAPYAAMDIFQGDRFIEGTEGVLPVAIPPVIDIGSGFAAWAMGAGDDQMLQRWASRVVPGGVGLRRALSVVPNVDTDWGLTRLARSLQNYYVDWGKPRADGMVPVMKADGTLVRYAKPSTMILRALGMDMRKFSTEAEVDRWLSRNRDDFSKLRRDFITSVLNSDWSRADQLQAQSQRKYGIPIRFSRSQLSSQMRTRTITRTERLLDRMSPDLRERYISAIQHKAPQLGLTPEQLGEPTATKRTQAGAQRPTPLSEEAEKYLEGVMTQDPMGVMQRYRE